MRRRVKNALEAVAFVFSIIVLLILVLLAGDWIVKGDFLEDSFNDRLDAA